MVVFDNDSRLYVDQDSGLTFGIVSAIPETVQGDIVFKIGHSKKPEVQQRLSENNLLFAVSNISMGEEDEESENAQLKMDTRWYLKERPLLEEQHQDQDDLAFVTEGIDDSEFQEAFQGLFTCILKQSIEHAERVLKENNGEL